MSCSVWIISVWQPLVWYSAENSCHSTRTKMSGAQQRAVTAQERDRKRSAEAQKNSFFPHWKSYNNQAHRKWLHLGSLNNCLFAADADVIGALGWVPLSVLVITLAVDEHTNWQTRAEFPVPSTPLPKEMT